MILFVGLMVLIVELVVIGVGDDVGGSLLLMRMELIFLLLVVLSVCFWEFMFCGSLQELVIRILLVEVIGLDSEFLFGEGVKMSVFGVECCELVELFIERSLLKDGWNGFCGLGVLESMFLLKDELIVGCVFVGIFFLLVLLMFVRILLFVVVVFGLFVRLRVVLVLLGCVFVVGFLEDLSGILLIVLVMEDVCMGLLVVFLLRLELLFFELELNVGILEMILLVWLFILMGVELIGFLWLVEVLLVELVFCVVFEDLFVFFVLIMGMEVVWIFLSLCV